MCAEQREQEDVRDLGLVDQQRPDEGGGQDDFEEEKEGGVSKARRGLDEMELGGELVVLVVLPPQADAQGVCVHGALDEAAHQTRKRLCARRRDQIEAKRGVKTCNLFHHSAIALPVSK